MFSLRKPTPAAIRAFLAQQSHLDLTYPARGATASTSPPGYVVDHTRIQLGHGEADFSKGKDALLRWQQFQLGWVEPCFPDAPIEMGQIVGVLASCFGVWSLNACQIVYVVDEPRRFGFAYGTLPGHVESGEERFLIEWNDEGVWYDILAFSRPRHLLAKIACPVVRRLQRRFARDSAESMRRAVAEVR